MGKVIKLSISTPEKFGPQRVRTRKGTVLEKHGQLNLFTGGKVVRLNQLSAFEVALMFDEQDDLAASKSHYLIAIEREEESADAYCNLGIIEFKEGNTTKAVDYFTLCLKDNPRHYEAHYNLANVYGEVGSFALSKVHYLISIEMEPSFPNSYFNLGLTLAMNKEFDAAVKALHQYCALTPEADHAQAMELIAKITEC